MKRLIAQLLVICILICSLGVLSSCNEDETDGAPDDESTDGAMLLDITGDFVIAYDGASFRAGSLAKSSARAT